MAKLASGTSVYGNISIATFVSAVGNVTGNYILGNGACLTGVITSVANINSGNSNVTVVAANGNVSIGVGGTANVAVFATTGEYVTGLISVSGNVISNNVMATTIVNVASHTGSVVSITGNVTANNVMATTIVNVASHTGSVVSITGNVTANNVMATNIVNVASHTGSVVSITGNVTANNVMATNIVNVASHTGSVVSITGNVTANNVMATNIVNVASHTGSVVSVTANVTGGNLLTGGQVSATGNGTFGNITSNSIATTSNGAGTNFKVGDDAWIGDINLGNTLSIRGVQSAAAGYIVFGNADGNALGRNSTGPLTYAGIFSATGNVQSGGNLVAVANVSGGNLVTGGLISSTGNITGGNLLTAGLISATGVITGSTLSSTGNIRGLGFYGNVAAGANINPVYVEMAANDFFRITTGGASNAGQVEFATADDGNEPFYFRQYTGTFATVTRTLTLLDANGDSTFPGKFFSTSTYNTTVGATNRAVYVDNTGLIGYLASLRESKTDIQDLSNPSWIYQLNPVEFKYRKKNSDGTYSEDPDGGVQYGMIAEDVANVQPEICFFDHDEQGNPTNLRGIDYNKLIPVLLKAVQDQKLLIDQLRQDLDQLRGA